MMKKVNIALILFLVLFIAVTTEVFASNLCPAGGCPAGTVCDGNANRRCWNTGPCAICSYVGHQCYDGVDYDFNRIVCYAELNGVTTYNPNQPLAARCGNAHFPYAGDNNCKHCDGVHAQAIYCQPYCDGSATNCGCEECDNCLAGETAAVDTDPNDPVYHYKNPNEVMKCTSGKTGRCEAPTPATATCVDVLPVEFSDGCIRAEDNYAITKYNCQDCAQDTGATQLVCGSDGITYKNPAQAECEGKTWKDGACSVDARGKCPYFPPPICNDGYITSTGETDENGCPEKPICVPYEDPATCPDISSCTLRDPQDCPNGFAVDEAGCPTCECYYPSDDGCTDCNYFMPACGIDGVTYKSICHAECKGVSVVKSIPCNRCAAGSQPDAVCGDDGITYYNPSSANCNGLYGNDDYDQTGPCDPCRYCSSQGVTPVCAMIGGNPTNFNKECEARCYDHNYYNDDVFYTLGRCCNPDDRNSCSCPPGQEKTTSQSAPTQSVFNEFYPADGDVVHSVLEKCEQATFDPDISRAACEQACTLKWIPTSVPNGIDGPTTGCGADICSDGNKNNGFCCGDDLIAGNEEHPLEFNCNPDHLSGCTIGISNPTCCGRANDCVDKTSPVGTCYAKGSVLDVVPETCTSKEVCYDFMGTGEWMDPDYSKDACNLYGQAPGQSSYWFDCRPARECVGGTPFTLNDYSRGLCCGDDCHEVLTHTLVNDGVTDHDYNLRACCNQDSQCVDQFFVCRDEGYVTCMHDMNVKCTAGKWVKQSTGSCPSEPLCEDCDFPDPVTNKRDGFVDAVDIAALKNNFCSGSECTAENLVYDVNTDQSVDDQDLEPCLQLVSESGKKQCEVCKNDKVDFEKYGELCDPTVTDQSLWHCPAYECDGKKTKTLAGCCDACDCTYQDTGSCVMGNDCNAECVTNSNCDDSDPSTTDICTGCECKHFPPGTDFFGCTGSGCTEVTVPPFSGDVYPNDNTCQGKCPTCTPHTEVCDDGADNDCDTYVDCNDLTCFSSPVCQPNTCNDGTCPQDADPSSECARCENFGDCTAEQCGVTGDQYGCGGTPNACRMIDPDIWPAPHYDTNTCDGHCPACEGIDPAETQEICDNGIDDNCNGFVDCYDADCNCGVCSDATCNPAQDCNCEDYGQCSVAQCVGGNYYACVPGVNLDIMTCNLVDPNVFVCADGSKNCIHANDNTCAGQCGVCSESDQPEGCCDNGVDDNCNGYIDCDDMSCQASSPGCGACSDITCDASVDCQFCGGHGDCQAETCQDPCTQNTDCFSDEFCDLPTTLCSGTGICSDAPRSCTADYKPVCGCDSVTYGNNCTRKAAKISLKALGTCEPPCDQNDECIPVCGVADPDCDNCDQNGVCNPDCLTPDPDCGHCITDDICIYNCPGDDPDCGKCGEDGTCIGGCYPDDPDCGNCGIGEIWCPYTGECVTDPNDCPGDHYCSGDCQDNVFDSCLCPECLGFRDNCEAGLVCNATGVCDNPQPPALCPSGTRLCGNGECCSDCNQCGGEVDCKNPAVCEIGDSCYCSECQGMKDFCQEGAFCMDDLCVGQCPAGTTLCADGSCSAHCDTPQGCIGPANEICAVGEGCACPDCDMQKDSCGWGAFCIYDEQDPLCYGQCPVGTTLCQDGSCSANCDETDTGNAGCIGTPNSNCQPGEGCACSDCSGKEDSCVRGAVCNTESEICVQQGCPEGTTLCNDGTCDATCSGHGGKAGCLNDNDRCDIGEGCACSECDGGKDTCGNRLVCEFTSQLCVKESDHHGVGGSNSNQVPCDVDEDTYISDICGGNDCDDRDATVNPGAIEICDHKDNDCDGTVDENCIDLPNLPKDQIDNDGDGYTADVDCNDNDPTIHPKAPEVCNGKDDDCDTEIDEGLRCDASFILDAQIKSQPRVLEVFDVELDVENSGDTTVSNIGVNLDVPAKWQYTGDTLIQNLGPKESKKVMFKVLIGDYDSEDATIRVDLTVNEKNAVSKNIPVKVSIPEFIVTPEPSLKDYKDKAKGTYYRLKFYYVINNRNSNRDLTNLDLEFGVYQTGLVSKETVAADLVSSGLFESEFTVPKGTVLIKEVPSGPYDILKGKTYNVAGYLFQKGQKVKESSKELNLKK